MLHGSQSSFPVILIQSTETLFSLGRLCRHIYLDRWMDDRYIGRWMDGYMDTYIHTYIIDKKIYTPVF